MLLPVVLLAAILALLVRPVSHQLRHHTKLIEQQELDDGVTIYVYVAWKGQNAGLNARLS